MDSDSCEQLQMRRDGVVVKTTTHNSCGCSALLIVSTLLKAAWREGPGHVKHSAVAESHIMITRRLELACMSVCHRVLASKLPQFAQPQTYDMKRQGGCIFYSGMEVRGLGLN